jgi:uncharacterized membrane protein
MASTRGAVLAALERWEARGLVAPELARVLRAEVEESTAREGTRWVQYILAGTGAVVLLIASGTFVAWAWPTMVEEARVGVLIVAALTVKFLGMWLETRDRWIPASYLMQTAGLGVLLASVAYSEHAWENATPGAIAVAGAGLGVSLVTAWLSIRRNPIMPAVHAAFGYAFLGLFMSRGLSLHLDEIVWILDGVLVMSILLLMHQIRAGHGESRSEWALNAFVASVYAGLVLVLMTALGPLNLDDGAALATDLWWAITVALTLWGIHGAPPALQRTWYGRQLGLAVALGILLAFWTAAEPLGLDDVGTSIVVAAYGVVWLWYALAMRSRPVVVAACLALTSAAWFLGIQEGGALGAVLALVFTAGLLFWVSARLGR